MSSRFANISSYSDGIFNTYDEAFDFFDNYEGWNGDLMIGELENNTYVLFMTEDIVDEAGNEDFVRNSNNGYDMFVKIVDIKK